MPVAATPIPTTRAEFLLVEAVLPHKAPETVGVLLFDASGGGRCELKMRRDWDQWMNEDLEEYFTHLADDFAARIASLGAAEFLRQAGESYSHTVRFSEPSAVLVDRFERTLERLYRQHVPARVQAFHTHLPVYSCRAAAGRWGEQMDVEAEGWREAPPGMRLTDDMFVAQVVGRSMEPVIPDGSWCVFRGGVTGSRTGRRVLVEDLSQSEEGGERYTVKVYTSEKAAAGEDGEWRHQRVLLKPLNPDFEAWELTEGSPYRVLAEFVRALD